MKKLLAILLLIPAPLLAQSTYSCSGTVTSVALAPSGLLTVSIGALTNVYLCEIGNSYNGVSADVCSAIYAHLLSARTTGSQELFNFNDTLTCTTHPTWAALTGWYYGPQFN